MPYHHNRALCSQTPALLLVPREFKSRMGWRAFSFQTLLPWNQLPNWEHVPQRTGLKAEGSPFHRTSSQTVTTEHLAAQSHTHTPSYTKVLFAHFYCTVLGPHRCLLCSVALPLFFCCCFFWRGKGCNFCTLHFMQSSVDCLLYVIYSSMVWEERCLVKPLDLTQLD